MARLGPYHLRSWIVALAAGAACGCNAVCAHFPILCCHPLAQTVAAAPTGAAAPSGSPTASGSPAAGGSGVQQTGYNEAGPDANKPTVTGSQLNLKKDETVVERALELTAKLATAEEQKKELACRVQQLTASLDEKEAALRLAEHEVLAASEEMDRARSELQHWREQVATLRDKLSGAEKENLETLQSIVGVLEKMLEHDNRSEEKREAPPDTELPKVPPVPK